LARSNVKLQGMSDAAKLAIQLRAEADVLLVPMSFHVEDKANMQAGFPSKLADYTALGLPLLVYGPPYCSAVRWAKATPGVAEVVESVRESELLTSALRRLAASPDLRHNLGKQALALGERCFSHSAAMRTFYQAIGRSPNRETAAARVHD